MEVTYDPALLKLFGPPLFTVPVPRRLLKCMSGDPFMPLKSSDHSPERLELLDALETSESTWEDSSSVCSSDLDSSIGSTCSSPVHMNNHEDEDGRGSLLSQHLYDDVYYSSDDDLSLPFDLCVGEMINSHDVPYRRRIKFSVWQTSKLWSQLTNSEKRESIYELSRVILEEMDVRQKLEITRIVQAPDTPSKIVIDLKTIDNEIWCKIKSYVQKLYSLCPKSPAHPYTMKPVTVRTTAKLKALKPGIGVPQTWRLQPNSRSKPVRLKANPKPMHNHNPRSLLRKQLPTKVITEESIKRVSTFRKCDSLEEIRRQILGGSLPKEQIMPRNIL